MPEYEELKLTVTLIDNASEGLVRLRQSLRSLGSGENREAMVRMQQETEKLGEKLVQVREHMGTTEKVAERLGRTIGNTMRTFATAFIANFAIDALRKFTDEMVRLDAASKQFGIGGAQLKGLVEQMGIMGISSQEATRAVTGFANSLAELGREGGQMKHELMKGALSNPDAMEAFIKRMTGLGSKGEIEKALNEFMDAADSVYQEEFNRTEGNAGKAAQLRNEWLEKWQLDPATMSMIKGRFKEITEAEIAEHNRRNAITQSFSTEWNKMVLQYDHFVEGLQIGLLPALNDINKAIGTMGDEWGKALGGRIGGELARQARAAQLWKDGKYWEAIKESLDMSFTGPLKDLDEKGWRAFLPHFTTPNESVGRRFGDWPADAMPPATATPPASKMSYRGGDSEMPPIIKASLGGGAPIKMPGGGDFSRSGGGMQGEMARAIRVGVFDALVDFRNFQSGGGGGGGGGGMPGFQRASLTTGGGGGVNAFGGNRTSASPNGPDGRDTTNNPNVGGGDQPVPGSILEKARSVAMLGPKELSAWMAKQGYPQHDNWCGDFASAVVRSAGGTPPKGWSVASNWRNVGPEVSAEDAQPGDVAVRRGTATGSTGSHVTILNEKLKGGRFAGLGGNQGGGRVSNYSTNKFQFYRPHVDDKNNATAGRTLDRDLGNEVKSKTESSGKLQTKVRAPAGTKVTVKGDGVLSKTETTRETPIGDNAVSI
jgi:hypothetical protein